METRIVLCELVVPSDADTSEILDRITALCYELAEESSDEVPGHILAEINEVCSVQEQG